MELLITHLNSTHFSAFEIFEYLTGSMDTIIKLIYAGSIVWLIQIKLTRRIKPLSIKPATEIIINNCVKKVQRYVNFTLLLGAIQMILLILIHIYKNESLEFLHKHVILTSYGVYTFVFSICVYVFLCYKIFDLDKDIKLS